MCFMPKTPDVQKPTAPPSVRDANIEGVKKRQQAAGSSESVSATGDQSTASTYKSTLGA